MHSRYGLRAKSTACNNNTDTQEQVTICCVTNTDFSTSRYQHHNTLSPYPLMMKLKSKISYLLSHKTLQVIRHTLELVRYFCRFNTLPVSSVNTPNDSGKKSPLKKSYDVGNILYEGWNFNSGNYLFTTDTK